MTTKQLRVALVGLVAVLAGLYAADFTRADSTEAQLAQCKAQLVRQLDEVLAEMEQKAKADPKEENALAAAFAKDLRPVAIGYIGMLSGPEGLSQCREAAAKNEADKKAESGNHVQG